MNKPDHTRPLINRRQFVQLISSSALLAPGLAWGEKIAQANAEQPNRDPAYQNLQDPWLTIAEVQQHLLPADDQSPGAEQIGALRFLQTMLQAQNDPQQTEFIHQGVGWLNQLANKQHQTNFQQLEPAQRESLLRQIETSDAGERWLSMLMTYLIEALLSDPVYGGNKNRLGWQWLEHIPGFPTPSADKVYFKLGAHASSRRRTKA